MKLSIFFITLLSSTISIAATTCPDLSTVRNIATQMQSGGMLTKSVTIDGVEWNAHTSSALPENITFTYAALNVTSSANGAVAAICVYSNSFYFESKTKGIAVPLSSAPYWGQSGKFKDNKSYICGFWPNPVSTATLPGQCAFEID